MHQDWQLSKTPGQSRGGRQSLQVSPHSGGAALASAACSIIQCEKLGVGQRIFERVTTFLLPLAHRATAIKGH